MGIPESGSLPSSNLSNTWTVSKTHIAMSPIYFALCRLPTCCLDMADDTGDFDG